MKRLINSCLLFIIAFPVSAQQINLTNNVFENYAYSVKMMGEFMARFNLQEVVVTPEQDSLWRYHNRVLLFDEATYLANDSVANEVLTLIERDSITLHYSDTNWIAIAKCQVKFNGRKDSIQIVLQPKIRKNKWYKWVIVDATGDILELKPKTESSHFYISPTDNELNFMSLADITQNNYRNITEYADNDFESDKLSVLYTLIYFNQLKIEHVSELTYHFDLPDNHCFDVRYFNRDSKNAGWLIYHIQ